MNQNVIEIKDLNDQWDLSKFLSINPKLTRGKFVFDNEADIQKYETLKMCVSSIFNEEQKYILVPQKQFQEQSIQTEKIEQEVKQINILDEQFIETKTDFGENGEDSQMQKIDESSIYSQINESEQNASSHLLNQNAQKQKHNSLDDPSQINEDAEGSNSQQFSQIIKSSLLKKQHYGESIASTGQEYQDQQSLKDNQSILGSLRDNQSILGDNQSPYKEQFLEIDRNQSLEILQNNEIDESILYEFLVQNKKQEIEISTEICLQDLKQNFTIQLKDYFIIEIIQQFYLNDWNKVIQSLSLQKKTMRIYVMKKSNIQQAKMDIDVFFKQISYLQINFCYQTNQTLINSSSMNNFLKTQGVFVFQVQDQFYLVSNQNSEEQLKQLSQSINDNYRGIILYFSSLKPFQTTSYDTKKILGNLRKEYYLKFLKDEIKNYSFHQVFNEQYFLCEMNFSKITQNKEQTEKIIKKHIQFHFQNLLLLQFKYLQSQTNDSIFQNLVQKQNQLKKKIIHHNKNGEFYLLGLSSDLAEIILAVEKSLATSYLKETFSQMEIKLLKMNFNSEIIDQESIDLQGALNVLQKQGLIIEQDNQEIICKGNKCCWKNLLLILRFWCDIHRNNQNQSEIKNLSKQFRENIQGKQLNVELDFLTNIQSFILEPDEVVNLNIKPNKVQQFSKKQKIWLNPPYLDIIIYNFIKDEFYDTFSNYPCQFEKIAEGVYQLQAFDQIVIDKFQNYFESFHMEEKELSEENLQVFELSSYLKKLFKMSKVYYIVKNTKLILVYTEIKKLEEKKQFIDNYLGKILYMSNLAGVPQNFKTESLGLISARIGFMQCFLSPQLKKSFPFIIEIEHFQETEILAFVIFHFNLNTKIIHCTKDQVDQIYQQIISYLQIQIYVEIKINNTEGLQLFFQISNQKQKNDEIYVSQKHSNNQNTEVQIVLLATKEALQQISQSCDVAKYKDETLKNMEFMFYIEQFFTFKNQVQFQEDKRKFKKGLEKKGFTVTEASIKWKVQTQNPQQIFSIFQLLSEKANTSLNMQDFLINNRVQEKPNIHNFDQSSIVQKHNLSDDKSGIAILHLLENSKVGEQNNFLDDLQQQGQHNPLINQNQQIFQSQNDQSRSQVDSSQDSQFQSQYNLNSEFLQKGLLIQFATERKFVNLQQNDSVVKYVLKKDPSIQLACFNPKVNENYIKYFENKTNNKTQDVYMIAKPEKEIFDTFSRKLILIKYMEKAVDKFLAHKNTILVIVKANANAKYWLPDKEKPEQICVKEDNQILPYQCYIRKEIL